MPSLHFELFTKITAYEEPDTPDINIRINNNRQWEAIGILNAIPKNGFIRSSMPKHTEACDLDSSFSIHRKHAYGYGQELAPDDSDMADDDDDDEHGMGGGLSNCAE